jgi:hypothetical protein
MQQQWRRQRNHVARTPHLRGKVNAAVTHIRGLSAADREKLKTRLFENDKQCEGATAEGSRYYPQLDPTTVNAIVNDTHVFDVRQCSDHHPTLGKNHGKSINYLEMDKDPGLQVRRYQVQFAKDAACRAIYGDKLRYDIGQDQNEGNMQAWLGLDKIRGGEIFRPESCSLLDDKTSEKSRTRARRWNPEGIESRYRDEIQRLMRGPRGTERMLSGGYINSFKDKAEKFYAERVVGRLARVPLDLSAPLVNPTGQRYTYTFGDELSSMPGYDAFRVWNTARNASTETTPNLRNASTVTNAIIRPTTQNASIKARPVVRNASINARPEAQNASINARPVGTTSKRRPRTTTTRIRTKPVGTAPSKPITTPTRRTFGTAGVGGRFQAQCAGGKVISFTAPGFF